MENINDKMLNNAALLFILTILLVIVGQWWMAPSYALTAEKVLQKVNDPRSLVLPEELSLLDKGEYTALVLSTESETINLPFDSKIFIPFEALLSKKSLKMIPADQQMLIFGETESQAVMALQLLAAKGYTKLRAVSNDLEANSFFLTNGVDPKVAFRKTEKATFDYPRFFKTNAKSVSQPAEVAKTETVKTQGGCS